MKKSVVYILAVILIISVLCGCGTDNTPKASPTVAPTATAQVSPSPDMVPDTDDGIVTDDDGILDDDTTVTDGLNDDKTNTGGVGNDLDTGTGISPSPAG